MTNLHEINFGLNQFCGPSVMSALTGKSTDECAAVISAVSGRQEIRAVQISHLIEAFARLRFDMTLQSKAGYTLFGNLSALSTHKGMYIIVVPKHVVAVEVTDDYKIYLVDNHSKQPLPAEGSARLSQKCEAVYKIIEKAKPKFLETQISIEKMYGNNIRIKAYDMYENSEDNVTRHLGQFTFKDRLELAAILRILDNDFDSEVI